MVHSDPAVFSWVVIILEGRIRAVSVMSEVFHILGTDHRYILY